MTDSWNAKAYSQFLDLRTRPARDLLAAIPNSFQPKTVYDLGCGVGNSTILLKNRWPHAQLVGLDSSSNMLTAAKAAYPGITFVQGDIADFAPTKKIDCLFANASLHWLDEHETLIPKLLKFINTHGVFGIQMPNNFHAPTHQITISILQHHAAWQPLLKNLRYGILKKHFYNLTWYYDLLTTAGAEDIQLWETEYVQAMPDYQAIFDWLKGTGLRPVLSAMDENNQIQFASTYIKAIVKAYPMQQNQKILLPFRRIFMLGYR